MRDQIYVPKKFLISVTLTFFLQTTQCCDINCNKMYECSKNLKTVQMYIATYVHTYI